MKKTLLLGSFAIFGLVANAQLVTEATAESIEAAGINSDSPTVEAGVVFAEGEAGTMAIGSTVTYKPMKACGDYTTVKVNDVEITIKNGVAGAADNGQLNSYAEGLSGGTYYELVPSKDGWLTIFTKMNPNKQYVVMEGLTSAMSYTLGYTNGTAKINYTLPYDPETYWIDFEDYLVGDEVDAEGLPVSYFVGDLGTDMVKPNFPWKVANLDSAPGENTGFLTFNVVADNKYYFAALGSKANVGVMVLTEGDDQPEITYCEVLNEDGSVKLPEVTFGGDNAGVGSIAVDNYDVNAPVYNVMGQKVNDDYKGIVIKNGKKFIRK